MSFEALIPIVTVVLLALGSVLVDRRLQAVSLLPMQWGLDGHVNWKANRRIALATTPALAALLLGWTAWRGEDDHSGQMVVVLLAMAAVFLAAHALHLWLVLHWAGRQEGP